MWEKWTQIPRASLNLPAHLLITKSEEWARRSWLNLFRSKWCRRRIQSTVGGDYTSSNPVCSHPLVARLVGTETLQRGDRRCTEISLSGSKESKILLLLCNASSERIFWVTKNKHQRHPDDRLCDYSGIIYSYWFEVGFHSLITSSPYSLKVSPMG